MPTYSEMLAQIEELQKQAQKQRKEEYASVLKNIKRQITEYGITAEELGYSPIVSPAKRAPKPARPADSAKPARKPRAKRATAGTKVSPKYKDDSGNTWTGRGKMPTWLAKAVGEGRTLESFLIAAAA